MLQPTHHAIQSVSQPLPRNVVALGFVSLLMGVSSQMTHSLLPVFLVTVLGASVVSVGVIEGIAEATNSLAKVLSGTVSDWFGRRKPIVVLGYGLAAMSKPLFPLSGDVGTVLVRGSSIAPAKAYATRRAMPCWRINYPRTREALATDCG